MQNLKTLFRDDLKENKGKLFLSLVMIFFIILGIYLRIVSLDAVRINEWVTRDFDRAFNLFDGNYVPFAGPEINNGGRLYGPFLYFFIAIPLLFKYSYESIFLYNFILNTLSLVMMYFIVKKYFNYYTAVISTILCAINPLHIDMVSFPINPSFIFPFLLLIIWFTLEFTLKNNYKYFPLIFFIITLSIQMHFSVSSYYLVPIITAIIYKIRIPVKYLFLTVFLILICLLPYFVYKKQLYEVKVEITKHYFNKKYSVSEVVKVVAVENVINKIANNHTLSIYPFPNHFRSVNYYLIAISFYGLMLYVFINSLRKGAESYKKEIVLILIFYIPALTYEILNPNTGWHYWHYFIFVPSYTIIIGLFVTALSQHVKTQIKFYSLAIPLFSLLAYLTYFTNYSFTKGNSYFSEHLIKIGTNAYHYYNYKHLISNTLVGLDLTDEQYLEKIYFEGYSSGSSKLIKLIRNDMKTPPVKENNDCYYLLRTNVVITGGLSKEDNSVSESLDKFLKDTTLNIDIDHPKVIIMKNKQNNHLLRLRVYKYKPKFNQPCYNNSFNIFSVDKKQRDLLRQSYGIDQGEKTFSIREISKKEKYDNDLKLVSWEDSFIVYKHNLNTPIKIKLLLKYNGSNYILRNEISYYSWGASSDFLIKELILTVKLFQEPPSLSLMTEKYKIISEDSWVSEYKSNNETENFKWFREFVLPEEISFFKDRFQFNLDWDIESSNQENFDFSTKIVSGGLEIIE